MKAITAALSQLPQLNYLDLLPTDVEFTDILRDGHFPNLSTLLYTVQPQDSGLLSAFLNQHPNIIHLSLTRSLTGPPAQLDPIVLPNLKTYNGASSFVSAFGPDDSSTIASVFLLWYGDDLDVEAPLLHLGKIASPDEFMAIFTSDPLDASTILGGVVTHLPRIKILRIMDCESGISHVRSCSTTLPIFLTPSCRKGHSKLPLISNNLIPFLHWKSSGQIIV